MDSNNTNKNGVVLESWKRPKELVKTATQNATHPKYIPSFEVEKVIQP